jgi:hypothetical protein
VYLKNPLFNEEGSAIMATPGIAWLDNIVKQANFPQTVDREGAALLYGQLTGFTPSKHTIRSWPIPYRVIGRSAIYKVRDVIEHARKDLEGPPRSGPGAPTNPDVKALTNP